jgi:hypothetical protein
MSRVQETLAAWRDGERRLEAAENADEIATLAAEVEALHRRYSDAVAENRPDEDEDTRAAMSDLIDPANREGAV